MLLLLRSRLISCNRPSNAFMEILLMLLCAMVKLNTTGSLPNDFFSSLVKLLWSRLKVRKDWREPRASLGGLVIPLPRRWSSWRVLRPLNLPPTRLSPSSLKSRSRLIKEFMVGQGCRPLISLKYNGYCRRHVNMHNQDQSTST